ncbi:MAG: 2-hydroxyacyl-CoA dehydratase [Clostridia bacterium]|nr:2-hydroxyacyl-CoA dehydratase [Clostridia bacterium]
MKARTGKTGRVSYKESVPTFTNEMKQGYTILAPNMLPYHFDILAEIVESRGYKVEILKTEGRSIIDEGLKHVHNDTCYPALCVIGQFIDALKSGKYDVNKTAVLITQSGGGCRASNYVSLLRKALKAEYPQVPVVSLNFSGLEKGNGLDLRLKDILKMGYGIFYADAIMSLYNQCKPYAKNPIEADRVRDESILFVKTALRSKAYKKYEMIVAELISRFKSVEIERTNKVKVGIVGEIYVKYSPLANNGLENFLYAEGCEPVVPALMDYVLYCIVNVINDAKLYNKGKKMAFVYKLIYKLLLKIQRNIIEQFEAAGFEPPHDFEYLRSCADKVIHQGVKMGEGWLIPAEMVALYESGTENIVCAQPFGCLPNHIVGKGAARAVKTLHEGVNIVPIDYDPSATKVNQENRLKLMLATARDKIAEQSVAVVVEGEVEQEVAID